MGTADLNIYNIILLIMQNSTIGALYLFSNAFLGGSYLLKTAKKG